MLRDEKGKFKSGNSGFWLGRKRPKMTGSNNNKWVGVKNNHVCIICSNQFRRTRPSTGARVKYCSMNCYGKSKLGKNTGEANNKWKGGVSSENSKIRRCKEYKEWRSSVYKRDGWTCQICKRHLKKLIAHHIKTFNKYPELRFELSNGITLCRVCHCKIHAENRDMQNFTKILNDYTLNISRNALKI